MNATTAALKFLETKLRPNLPEGILSIDPIDRDAFRWDVTVSPAAGSPYSGALFHAELALSEPPVFSPPRVRVTSPIFHPSIMTGEWLCLNRTLEAGDWTPGLTGFVNLLVALRDTISVPCVRGWTINPEARALFESNRQAFDERARRESASN